MLDWMNQLAGSMQSSLLQAGMEQFYTFLLTLVRLSGLMVIGPFFGQSVIPINIRIFFCVTLAWMVTPAISHHSERVFSVWDVNQNGEIQLEEIPVGWEERFNLLRMHFQKSDTQGLTSREFRYRTFPQNLLELCWIMAGELLLGFGLGLGMYIIMSGLQLAGHLIDQQSGFSLGEVLNPDFSAGDSATGQMLLVLGTSLFLLAAPVAGHLQLLSILLETFATMPVGTVWFDESWLSLVNHLVHGSFILAIRVAAPLLMIVSLVDLTLAFLGRTVQTINIFSVGFAIRALVSYLVLTVMLAGMSDLLPELLEDGLEQMRQQWRRME